MPSASLLPLALLYADEQSDIEGITRFQKLVFLAQKEAGVEEFFEFKPDKYGPFSTQLYATLDELERRSLVKKQVQRTRGGNEKYIYTLSSHGKDILGVIRQGEDRRSVQDMLNSAQSIKERYGSYSLNQLLEYVYSEYPTTANESVLKID